MGIDQLIFEKAFHSAGHHLAPLVENAGLSTSKRARIGHPIGMEIHLGYEHSLQSLLAFSVSLHAKSGLRFVLTFLETCPSRV